MIEVIIYYKACDKKLKIVDGAMIKKGGSILLVTTQNHTPFSGCCSPMTREVPTGVSVKLHYCSKDTQGVIGNTLGPSPDDVARVKYTRGKINKLLVPGNIIMKAESDIPLVVTSTTSSHFYARCLLSGARFKYSKMFTVNTVKIEEMK